MKATHTQGEWKVTTDGQKVTSILDRNDANGFNNVCSINEHVEEREANAKLIASAPALLETLQDTLVILINSEEWIDDMNHEGEYADLETMRQKDQIKLIKKAIKQATE